MRNKLRNKVQKIMAEMLLACLLIVPAVLPQGDLPVGGVWEEIGQEDGQPGDDAAPCGDFEEEYLKMD